MHAVTTTHIAIWITIICSKVVRLHKECSTQFHTWTDIKTHDSESRGQEEAGRTRDEQVSYLHVAPL